MTRKLTSGPRQRRMLNIPPPGRKGNIKVPFEGWVECAKVILIEDGIGAVKIDRLATRLRVTRGGFYYHFRNHNALLEALLAAWRRQNRFIPSNIDTQSVDGALEALERLADSLIHERHFDPQFDMAVREWARISQPVADVVHEEDRKRMAALRRIFRGLGYSAKEANIRARVFYMHQMGYYTLAIEESTAVRQNNLETYLHVLGGERYIAASLTHSATKRARLVSTSRR